MKRATIKSTLYIALAIICLVCIIVATRVGIGSSVLPSGIAMQAGQDIVTVQEVTSFSSEADANYTGKTVEEITTIVIFALGNACGAIGVILFIATLVIHIKKRTKEKRTEQAGLANVEVQAMQEEVANIEVQAMQEVANVEESTMPTEEDNSNLEKNKETNNEE